MLYFALLSAAAFSLIYSASEAFSEGVLDAWYRKSRKKIHRKWNFIRKARSECSVCGKNISWYYLIPIIGYILARGKCEHCGRSIPRKYPLFETASFCYGFLSGFYIFDLGFHILGLIYFFFIVFIAKTDWEFLLIPLEAILVIMIIAFLEFFIYGHSFQTAMIALFWTLFFILLHILRPNSLGRADIYYVFALTMAIPFPGNIFLPMLASVLGLLFYLVRFPNKKNLLKIKAPFGVFLGISFLILRLLPFSNLYP